MSTRGAKSLAVRAKQQISICCETLCEKNVVEEYIEELESRIKFLEDEYFARKANLILNEIRKD
jgi:hypothetical protein